MKVDPEYLAKESEVCCIAHLHDLALEFTGRTAHAVKTRALRTRSDRRSAPSVTVTETMTPLRTACASSASTPARATP